MYRPPSDSRASSSRRRDAQVTATCCTQPAAIVSTASYSKTLSLPITQPRSPSTGGIRQCLSHTLSVGLSLQEPRPAQPRHKPQPQDPSPALSSPHINVPALRPDPHISVCALPCPPPRGTPSRLSVALFPPCPALLQEITTNPAGVTAQMASQSWRLRGRICSPSVQLAVATDTTVHITARMHSAPPLLP